MKQSELKSFIKEEIIDILGEAKLEIPASKYKDVKDELGDDDEVRIVPEDIDVDDDKDAIAQAKKARGKFKKLDLAVKALKDIETEMKSLARKYSAADETEKEKIKDILREKTPKKKELEALVAKLEKDVV
tara:strand:- start:1102 stop:1494 length:393 start_codon:yes stop_codon:yes gene_type:complete